MREISRYVDGYTCRKRREGREAYRDEISHGKVVRQGRRNLLVLALELGAAGYHQFFRRIANGKSLDCMAEVSIGNIMKERGLPVIGLV